MQFFKAIISSLLVAAAIAAPAPEANSRPVEARVPEFGNVEPLMAELISRAAEVEGTLEARAPILCDIACKGSCFVKGKKGGVCRNGTCYCG